MHNTVVVHFKDGKILKGKSNDFVPTRPSFHLEKPGTGRVTEVEINGLKAVCFVRSFTGDAVHNDNPNAERIGFGKRREVTFEDGEKITGYTSGYSPSREAFFMFPADAESNNEKIFVVASSTTDVRFL
jgi:hypothetical protein